MTRLLPAHNNPIRAHQAYVDAFFLTALIPKNVPSLPLRLPVSVTIILTKSFDNQYEL